MENKVHFDGIFTLGEHVLFRDGYLWVFYKSEPFMHNLITYDEAVSEIMRYLSIMGDEYKVVDFDGTDDFCWVVTNFTEEKYKEYENKNNNRTI